MRRAGVRGGHVVLPLLQAAVVEPGWTDDTTFLAGYGVAQALPGPLFTFAACLGALVDPVPLSSGFSFPASRSWWARCHFGKRFVPVLRHKRRYAAATPQSSVSSVPHFTTRCGSAQWSVLITLPSSLPASHLLTVWRTRPIVVVIFVVLLAIPQSLQLTLAVKKGIGPRFEPHSPRSTKLGLTELFDDRLR
jgi:chromate transporter